MKNILFVAGLVGPKFDYALPRVAQHGELYSYIPNKLPDERYNALVTYSKEIIEGKFLNTTAANQSELAEDIANVALKVKANAILALDEFYIDPASHAAIRVRLRGAGKHVGVSRHKYEMRRAFQANNVPCPKYLLIKNKAELEEACRTLKFPFLLKVTEGAGSFANVLVQDKEQAQTRYDSLCELVQDMGKERKFGIVDSFLIPEFIAEEVIQSTTKSWYDITGYGDYLSVEGMVVGGHYSPISITSRMPTIYPFIETAIQTPCILKPELQYKIAYMAKQAVDALKLDYCATHTEIKLMANQHLCLIESAARAPGASIVRMIEDSFGMDVIGMLVEVLLYGKSDVLPKQLVTDYKRASGAVALLPADASGDPWRTTPIFTKSINWRAILPSEIQFSVDWTPSLKELSPIPKYDPQKGLFNYFGGVLMTCEDPKLLIKAQHDVLNRGEALFSGKL